MTDALEIFPLDDEPVGAPHGAILIGAGSDPDDISWLGGRGGGGRQAEGAARANIEDLGCTDAPSAISRQQGDPARQQTGKTGSAGCDVTDDRPSLRGREVQFGTACD